MRITELSERSGLSISTIKYYRREGLLPPGRSLGPNRVQYDRRHLSRLRLIRQLVEVGGLTLAAVRALLEILDDPAHTPFQVLATAGGRRKARCAASRGEAWQQARSRMARMLARSGWRVRGDAAALDEAADVLSALQGFDYDIPADLLAGYVRLARATVAEEVRLAHAMPFQVHMTIFYNELFAVLRRLAREDWGLRQGLGAAAPLRGDVNGSGHPLPRDDSTDRCGITPPARTLQ
ncbi:MerR family transcriptional regulator [Nonomuraea sp. NBC_00507]|uniref:MerR family transcriptional regulator n=1 Tax=Nonomuraea sp. NBC_00507 TaxID=2976002 RepID=UPI002E19526B